ncbi:MAG: CcoQ/FixQ family Cbb3-type cytochrome c oxidase assembly chaperone [Rickettsiales bacterium]|nr:CcoQ/FixQ family Cbb3-type cytochrome c oxidase assembly chaperone [Rickettsiales bacterium]
MIDFITSQAPTIATLFFFLTFCYVIFSVFKKGTSKKFDKYSQIPFKEREILMEKPKTKSKK